MRVRGRCPRLRWHQAFGLEYAAFGLEYAAFGLEYAAFGLEYAAFGLEHRARYAARQAKQCTRSSGTFLPVFEDPKERGAGKTGRCGVEGV